MAFSFSSTPVTLRPYVGTHRVWELWYGRAGCGWNSTRRAWSASDLAHEARISPATVSAAISGRSISVRSLSLIAEALLRVPSIEMIDCLVVDDAEQVDL